MPRISLWNSHRSNDYKMSDGATSEYMGASGAGIFVHKYLGVGDNEDLGEIEDLLFLENRDRNYSEDVVELRGNFSPVDTDYDLSQFGIFLSSDTLRFDFHYSDMIQLIGRKLMSGDVLEIPAERDVNLDGIIVNSYYVVEDAMYSSSGYSVTWDPHIWKVRAKKMDGSPEFDKILDSAAKRSTLGNEGGFTGLMPQGIADFLDGDMYDQDAKDAVSRYGKMLGINDAVISEAQCNVYFDPKFFNGSHFYINVDQDGYPELLPWRAGTDEPPNGGYLRGIGTVFPDNMQDGEYFLRVDFEPDRLFQKQGKRFVKIQDDLRRVWTAYNTRLDTYIDNNNVTTLQDGSHIPEKTSMHTALDPKVDIHRVKKNQLADQKCKDSFVAKTIGNVGSKDRGWGCKDDCPETGLQFGDQDPISGNISIEIELPTDTKEIPPLKSWDIIIASDERLVGLSIIVNGYTYNNLSVSSLNYESGLLYSTYSVTIPTSFENYRGKISIRVETIIGGESISVTKDFDDYINGFYVPVNDAEIEYPSGEGIGEEPSILTFNYDGIDDSLIKYGDPIFDFGGDEFTFGEVTIDPDNKTVSVEVYAKNNVYNPNAQIDIYTKSITNGYEKVYQVETPVSTSDPYILNDSVEELNYGDIETLDVFFSQDVKVLSTTNNSEYGNISIGTNPEQYTNSVNVTADLRDSLISTTNKSITFTVQTYDGRIFDLHKYYTVVGEKMRSIIVTFPDESFDVPFISDMSQLISMEATILSSPELKLSMNYVGDIYQMNGPEDYTFDNGTIIFNKDILMAFYYETGISIEFRIKHT